MLFTSLGLVNAQEAVDTMGSSANSIANISGTGANLLQNITNELNSISSTTLSALINELSNTSELCPDNPTLSGDQNMQVLGKLSTSIVQELERLQSHQSSFNLDSTIRSLQQNNEQASKVYESMDNITLASWESLLAIIPGCILSILLITSTSMAWNHDKQIQSNTSIRSTNSQDHRWFRCMIVWFIVPLFVILLGVSIATCLGVVVAAGANSDFCYPPQYASDPNAVLPAVMVSQLGNFTELSVHLYNGQPVLTPLNAPDISSLQILLSSGYDINSTSYLIVTFYVAQCASDAPYEFFQEYIPTLVSDIFWFITSHGHLLVLCLKTVLACFFDMT
jgi:hypothetical protein